MRRAVGVGTAVGGFHYQFTEQLRHSSSHRPRRETFKSRKVMQQLISYSQIPLRYLVRTSFEPAPNQLRTSFKPDSVMEFGREPASSC